MLYAFKIGDNVMEATKNICCATGEGTIDQRTVNRRYNNFRMCYKNLDKIR